MDDVEDVEVGGPVSTGPASTGPAAPDHALPDHAAPDPASPGPAVPGTATTQHDLDVRYGRVPAPRRRRLQRLAGTVTVGAALAWVVWAGLGQAGADVRHNDVGYTVVSASQIDVAFDVNKDPERTALCTVQAFDRSKATIGLVEVSVGPAEQRVVREVASVRTAAQPASAAVQGCTLVP